MKLTTMAVAFLISGASLLLSACSTRSSTGGLYLSNPHQDDCTKSSVLLTNLTEKPRNRAYQLTDGRDCTEVVNGQ